MKKLGLILGMVFAASWLMAQNTATVNEIGNSNIGTANQTGDLNRALVQQNGNSNSAIITQVGDANIADQADNAASSLFGLLSSAKGITQAGNSNIGVISQTSNVGTLSGNGPIAGMYQQGISNNATINQFGDNLHVFNQEYAWVEQIGDGNVSLQDQNIVFGYSHILQQGNNNNARTLQIDAYSQKASIWQVGTGNIGFIQQGDNVTFSYGGVAELTQNGNGNYAVLWQKGVGDPGSDSNGHRASIIENGNSNAVTGLSGVPGDPAIQDGTQHNLTVLQQGDNNLGKISQLGNANTGTLNQVGNGNIGTINQN